MFRRTGSVSSWLRPATWGRHHGRRLTAGSYWFQSRSDSRPDRLVRCVSAGFTWSFSHLFIALFIRAPRVSCDFRVGRRFKVTIFGVLIKSCNFMPIKVVPIDSSQKVVQISFLVLEDRTKRSSAIWFGALLFRLLTREFLRSNASSDRVALKGLLIELLKSHRLVYMTIFHLVHFAKDAQVDALSFVDIFLKRFSAQIDPWPSDGFNETHGNIKSFWGFTGSVRWRGLFNCWCGWWRPNCWSVAAGPWTSVSRPDSGV